MSIAPFKYNAEEIIEKLDTNVRQRRFSENHNLINSIPQSLLYECANIKAQQTYDKIIKGDIDIVSLKELRFAYNYLLKEDNNKYQKFKDKLDAVTNFTLALSILREELIAPIEKRRI
ncbi:MAG: hypothetical protein FP824_06550 [Euryarchaeota archaeon]|nr:hypothetical protein [Euryarchaeota archaeon]MBU4144049.1 hypothetical protein [Candidatus Thermoplasmatota archaeon]